MHENDGPAGRVPDEGGQEGGGRLRPHADRRHRGRAARKPLPAPERGEKKTRPAPDVPRAGAAARRRSRRHVGPVRSNGRGACSSLTSTSSSTLSGKTPKATRLTANGWRNSSARTRLTVFRSRFCQASYGS